MYIPSQQLLRLPVVTRSGQRLGRVIGFEMDIDTGVVCRYQVRIGLLSGLWNKTLLIDRSQVVSISVEKMVVEDMLTPIGATQRIKPATESVE
jgi:sporulation protein YlmC with PRC-barrel domain